MIKRSSILILLTLLCRSIEIDEQCFQRDTCSHESDERSPSIYGDETFIRSRNCFCDSMCEEFGDCCSTISQTSTYQCVDYLLPTINNKSIPFPRLSVWMKTDCLPLYVGSIVDQQCRNLNGQTFSENPLLFIPVTSVQTNVTYRNFYCAYCNNDDFDRIQFWEYKPFCHGDGSDNDYLTLSDDEQVQYYVHNLTKNCLKTIVYPHERGSTQPSVFIRPCKQILPSICPPETSFDLAENCSNSDLQYRYIVNRNVIYPNEFCAQCHHENLSELTCFDPYLRSSLPPLSLIRIHPLSILFDPNLLKRYLNNSTIPRIIYSTNYNCSKSNELYNLIENKCTTVRNSSDEFILSINCSHPMQTFLQFEDLIYYRNGSLYLANASILLRRDEYVFISDRQIVFCADRWSIMDDSIIGPISFPLYRHVLSIICTSISLGCLLFFLIIFWLVPSLHNLPGKCLLSLSICLFVGQLTFIISSTLSRNSSGCFASAVLIHYFYLSSFIWLLIISIQIHSTFHQQLIQRDSMEKKTQRILAFNLFVWCSAGIVVLVACLIQFIRPQSSFSPGYAAMFCSISNGNALIVFFLVPIGLIEGLVTILFVKTLWSIHRSRFKAKISSITTSPSSTTTNQHRMIFIYARLACLMGIQWIFLIFALVIGQTWSWVIFEIINSLPGVFICLGFLCSKRLFNMIRQRINMNIVKRRPSSRSNATTSTFMISPSLPSMSNQRKRFHF